MSCMQSRDALFLKSLMEVVSRPSQNNGAVVLSNLLADAREVQKGNLCSKLSKVGKKDAAAEEMESHDDVSSDASDDYYRAVHSSRSIGRAGTGLNAVLGNAADYRSYATLLNADLKKQTKHRDHLKSKAVVVRSKKAAQLITDEKAWGVAQIQSMRAGFKTEEKEIASEAIELTKRSCELCVQLRDHEEHAAKEMAAVDVDILHEQDALSASLAQFLASLEQSCKLLNDEGLKTKSKHKRQEEDLLNDLGKKRRLVSRIVQRMHDLALQKL